MRDADRLWMVGWRATVCEWRSGSSRCYRWQRGRGGLVVFVRCGRVGSPIRWSGLAGRGSKAARRLLEDCWKTAGWSSARRRNGQVRRITRILYTSQVPQGLAHPRSRSYSAFGVWRSWAAAALREWPRVRQLPKSASSAAPIAPLSGKPGTPAPHPRTPSSCTPIDHASNHRRPHPRQMSSSLADRLRCLPWFPCSAVPVTPSFLRWQR